MADILNMPSNNENSKPVVVQSAEVINRKPKLLDETTFWGSIVKEVVIPNTIDLIYNAGYAALNRLCYGNTNAKRGGYKSSHNGNVLYKDYNSLYSSKPVVTNGGALEQVADKYRAKANITSIKVNSMEKVNQVIDELTDRLQYAGVISVGDLYDICEIGAAPSTSMNWGWTDISKIRWYRDYDEPDKFIIEMPKCIDIRKL